MGLFQFLRRVFEKICCKPKFQKKYYPLTFLFKNNYGLNYQTEKKAIVKHNKLVQQFKQKNKRYPTRYEIGKIIVDTSHKTIEGLRYHWRRQKIRHYLFNRQRISYFKR